MVEAVELEKPLDPDLNYFDATPSIEELARQLADVRKAMELQSTINANILLKLKELLDDRQDAKPRGLILPERMTN